MAVPDTNQTFTFNANMSPTLQTQPSYLGIGNNPATTQQFFNMGQNQSGGGNWMQQAGSWLNSDSMSQGMGLGSMSNMNMILQADQMGGQLMGLLAGQNESTVGNIVKSIPGLSTVGNLINAAFGSSINEEFVNQTKSQTNALGSQVFNSNTNADVLNDWQNMTAMSHVRKSEVGSDGWFSSDAEDTTDDLNRKIDKANKRQLFNFDLAVNNADRNTDFRILSNMTAYGGPINSFRKYYSFGGSLYDTPQFFSVEPQTYDKGGYLSQAKALIRQNEGWREKPYADAPKGKNWRSVGYGFNDSGFRDKYPEGISKHYEHGITRKQAEEELDYFLNRAEKTLKGIYGKQWNDFTDSQKAAILDTYYQRPASVGKSSRFYKAVTAGEDAGKYLGVAGYNKRNKVRQGVFGGSQDYVNLGIETGNTESNPSTLQEVTPFTPVVHDLDLSGITPTEAKALELNLTSPTFDLSMFGKPMTTPTQQAVPTVGTVEDFLASYGDFEENLFEKGGNLYSGGGYTKTYIDSRGREVTFHRFPRETDEQYEARYAERVAMRERNAAANKARYERRRAANEAGAARLNRAINTVTNVMEEQAKATPFTGQEIQQAAEEQRQEKLDKWRDYKKGINATITAAELGLSGASLLGAYANWRNWATAANATKRGIANLLQKAQLPMQIGGTLIDGYQTYDALQNNDNYNANYNGISTGLGVAGSVGASDIFLNSRFHSPKVDRVLDAMGVIQNSGDFIKFGYDSMFGNKKAEGGPIHIAPSKEGTFTAAASKHGLGDNLFAGGGWMDFFNMWNQAQGGNNYFGNNWKPSDGLQRTTSNGNAGDWMGVAGTTINTLANWGKEDPSLGRGGGYSMFGMAAYDIMKAIRNATKSKRESIGQKLAIPIYAQGGHLFDDGGSIGALGYANIANSALKLASNVKHQTELDIDPDKVYRSADRYGMGLDEAVANVNTNGDLLDLWANNSTVSANLNGRDFRDKSYFDDFLDSYAASWEGFNAGQNFGPWGAAIGAVIGGGSSVIGSIIGRNKADNAAETANRRLENANERRAHNLIAAAERVDEENDLRILQNMDNQGANGGKLSMGFGLRNPFIMPDGTANPLFRAFGGGLTHGSDWDTGINWVNEGGSHGENPLGGVQMGVDEQGVPNLVEEGEAIWNGDYVFSKRMKVPKKLAQKYGLGGDMTFADAIAKLTKDSEERPLSNIDRATNDHILGEFADSQEELRMAKAQRAMDKEIQLQDDFLTGFQFGLGGHMSPIGIIPDADNISPFEKAEKLFADGGGIHIDPSKKGTFKAQASKMGMGVQEAASHILAHKENYSPEMVKKANFARNSSKWHEDGGFLFDNSFAYGGPFGNVFDGDGNKPNTLRSRAFDYPIFDAPWHLGMVGTKDITYPNTKKSFGDMQNENWFKIYNPDQWYGPENDPLYQGATASTSNKGEKKGKGNAKSSKSAQKGVSATRTPNSDGIYSYGYYTNGSDGISEPTGFKVGKGGKAYEYTKEYKDLVDKLTADDIRAWAKAHPNDPSLKSFIARGNNLDKLTTEQWRKGATDGKYGFMHHVADQISKEKDRVPADFNWEQEAPWLFGNVAAPQEQLSPMEQIARDKSTPTRSVSVTDNGTNFGVVNTPQAITRSGITDTTSGAVDGITRSPFKPKQTWTRYAPMVMSGLMGLKEMLTPADYANADAIMAAAYQAGAPVSVGTEYIGDYRKRDPFDETYLMNIINQNSRAANRNFMNISGGNRAAAMSGILANDLVTQRSLAEAARQAYLANRADDADVAAFNKDTNKYNATTQNTRNLSLAQLNSGRQSAMLSGIAQGARLRQAIKDQRDAAISANLTNFAQGLGDLGKENGYYNMLGGLNEEGILKYFYGDDWKTKFNNVNG